MKKAMFVAIMLLGLPLSAQAERIACITPTLLQKYTNYATKNLEEEMLVLRQKDACIRLYKQDILLETQNDDIAEITHSSGFTVYAQPAKTPATTN